MISVFHHNSFAHDGLNIGFRELTGHHEKMLPEMAISLQSKALWLAQSLATTVFHAGDPIDFDTLSLSEFDACLAHLYTALYGSNVPCEAACEACDERYEFTLDLHQLQSQIQSGLQGFTLQDDATVLSKSSGRRFRLPRICDLSNLNPKKPENWLQDFLEDGDFDFHAFEEELELANPVLSQDIIAACPECEHENKVRFDIARYFMETLENESGFLWREVHLLAHRYGWGLDEILNLSRPIRRQLAGLVVADRTNFRLAS
jgi:hypothetical protein